MFSANRSILALYWLKTATSVLILAGFFALTLVVARTPFLSSLFPDPYFFKKGLVLHVNLALSVFILCFILFLLEYFCGNPSLKKNKFGVWLSWIGIFSMVVSAWIPDGYPILSNYIPIIEHPIYQTGVVIYFLGILISILDNGFIPKKNQSSELHQTAFRISGILVLVAIQTILIAIVTTNYNQPESYYEIIFWGGGHIFQLASEAAKMGIWIYLVQSISPIPDKKKKIMNWVLFAYLVPALIVIPFSFLSPTTSASHRVLYTDLMKWGIFPFTGIVFLLLLTHIKPFLMKKEFLMGLSSLIFLLSSALTLAGYILGAMIQESTTLIPAHYHVAIGSVSLSFMAFTYIYFEKESFSIPKFWIKKIKWQPVIFGTGQLILGIGFALAGNSGMVRKIYGAQQSVKGFSDYLGMTLAALGGLLAILGGIQYLLSVSWIFYFNYKNKKGITKYKNLEVTYGK